MVADHIDHNPNVSGVAKLNQVLQVLLGAEVAVELVDIPTCVAMVVSVVVVDYWGDPYGVEPHALDVVEIVHDPTIGATAIVSQIATWISVAIALRKAVGKQLVDCPTLPLLRSVGLAEHEQSKEQDC